MSDFQPKRDLSFTHEHFERIRTLIAQKTGLALAPHKEEMVYSRLARRLRSLGISCFGDYISLLDRDREHPEWERFVNALTTNLTSFFREPYHFPLLADYVRARQAPLSIWCCAASTGEEPYSIAMTLVEALGSSADKVRIVATDIDTDAIKKARAGIYALTEVEKLSEAHRKRFFLRGSGSRAGLARVTDRLRRMIEFRALNLVDRQWALGETFDVIFCRNVMIYFDKETQSALLKRFARVLKPDGLLFAGHSENFSQLTDEFMLRQKTVYELKSEMRVA